MAFIVRINREFVAYSLEVIDQLLFIRDVIEVVFQEFSFRYLADFICLPSRGLMVVVQKPQCCVDLCHRLLNSQPALVVRFSHH